jgi:hypothetical protein
MMIKDTMFPLNREYCIFFVFDPEMMEALR